MLHAKKEGFRLGSLHIHCQDHLLFHHLDIHFNARDTVKLTTAPIKASTAVLTRSSERIFTKIVRSVPLAVFIAVPE